MEGFADYESSGDEGNQDPPAPFQPADEDSDSDDDDEEDVSGASSKAAAELTKEETKKNSTENKRATSAAAALLSATGKPSFLQTKTQGEVEAFDLRFNEAAESGGKSKATDTDSEPASKRQAVSQDHTSANPVTPAAAASSLAGVNSSKKKEKDVKDRVKTQRVRGQSAHATWKSEGEMKLRQQYD